MGRSVLWLIPVCLLTVPPAMPDQGALPESIVAEDSACYGSTQDTSVNLTCKAHGNYDILVKNVGVGAKLSTLNCPLELTGSDTADETVCCQPTTGEGCYFRYDGISHFEAPCSGKQSCKVQPGNTKTGSNCDQTLYPDVTHFMSIGYYCIAESRIHSMCTTVDVTVDAGGEIVYLQNQGYPNAIATTDTSCDCSVETDTCNTSITMYTVDRRLQNEASACKQSLTLKDGDGVQTLGCTDNTDFAITTATTATNYLKLEFANTMNVQAGHFWMGFKDILPIIIGVVIGFVLIAVIIIVLVCCVCKKKKARDEEKAPLEEEGEVNPTDGVTGAEAALFNTEEKMDAAVAPARTAFVDKRAEPGYVSYHIPHDENPGGSVASLPRYESPIWSPKDERRIFSPDQSSPAGILLSVTPYEHSPANGMSHESVRRDVPGGLSGTSHVEVVGLGNRQGGDVVRGEPTTSAMVPDVTSHSVPLHPVLLPPLTDLGQLDKVKNKKHKKKKKRKHKERKDTDENENVTIRPAEDADQVYAIHDNDLNTQPEHERKRKNNRRNTEEGKRTPGDMEETQQPEERPDGDNESSVQFVRHGSRFSNKVAPLTGEAIEAEDERKEKKKKNKKHKHTKDTSEQSEARSDGAAVGKPATEPIGHDAQSASNTLAPLASGGDASLTRDNDEQRARRKKHKTHKHRQNDMNAEDMPEGEKTMNKDAEDGAVNTEPPLQGSLVVFSSTLPGTRVQEEGVQGPRETHKKHKHRGERDGGRLVEVDDNYIDTSETTV